MSHVEGHIDELPVFKKRKTEDGLPILQKKNGESTESSSTSQDLSTGSQTVGSQEQSDGGLSPSEDIAFARKLPFEINIQADREEMGGLEAFGKIFANSFNKALSGLIQGAGELAKGAVPSMLPYELRQNPLSEAAQSVRETQFAIDPEYTGDVFENPSAKNIIGTLANLSGSIIPSVAGAAVPGLAPAALATLYGQAIEGTHEAAKQAGLNENQTGLFVMATAPVIMALEKAGFGKLAKIPARMLANKIAAETYQEIVEKGGGKLTTELFEETLQKNTSKWITKIKDAGAGGLEGIIAELPTEGAQEFAQIISEKTANELIGEQKFKDLDVGSVLERISKSAILGGIGGGLGGAVISMGVKSNTYNAVVESLANDPSPENQQSLIVKAERLYADGKITEEELTQVGNTVKRIAEVSATIPESLNDPEKRKLAIDAINLKAEVNEAIQAKTEELNSVDEGFKEGIAKQIADLEIQKETINDRLQETATDEKYIYYKEGEAGKEKYFKRLGEKGTPQPITPLTYEFEIGKQQPETTPEPEVTPTEQEAQPTEQGISEEPIQEITPTAITNETEQPKQETGQAQETEGILDEARTIEKRLETLEEMAERSGSADVQAAVSALAAKEGITDEDIEGESQKIVESSLKEFQAEPAKKDNFVNTALDYLKTRKLAGRIKEGELKGIIRKFVGTKSQRSFEQTINFLDELSEKADAFTAIYKSKKRIKKNLSGTFYGNFKDKVQQLYSIDESGLKGDDLIAYQEAVAPLAQSKLPDVSKIDQALTDLSGFIPVAQEETVTEEEPEAIAVEETEEDVEAMEAAAQVREEAISAVKDQAKTIKPKTAGKAFEPVVKRFADNAKDVDLLDDNDLDLYRRAVDQYNQSGLITQAMYDLNNRIQQKKASEVIKSGLTGRLKPKEVTATEEIANRLNFVNMNEFDEALGIRNKALKKAISEPLNIAEKRAESDTKAEMEELNAIRGAIRRKSRAAGLNPLKAKRRADISAKKVFLILAEERWQGLSNATTKGEPSKFLAMVNGDRWATKPQAEAQEDLEAWAAITGQKKGAVDLKAKEPLDINKAVNKLSDTEKKLYNKIKEVIAKTDDKASSNLMKRGNSSGLQKNYISYLTYNQDPVKEGQDIFESTNSDAPSTRAFSTQEATLLPESLIETNPFTVMNKYIKETNIDYHIADEVTNSLKALTDAINTTENASDKVTLQGVRDAYLNRYKRDFGTHRYSELERDDFWSKNIVNPVRTLLLGSPWRFVREFVPNQLSWAFDRVNPFSTLKGWNKATDRIGLIAVEPENLSAKQLKKDFQAGIRKGVQSATRKIGGTADLASKYMGAVSAFKKKFKELTNEEFNLDSFLDESEKGEAYRSEYGDAIAESRSYSNELASRKFGAQTATQRRFKRKGWLPFTQDRDVPVDKHGMIRDILSSFTEFLQLNADRGRIALKKVTYGNNQEKAQGAREIAEIATKLYSYYVMAAFARGLRDMSRDDEDPKKKDLSEAWDQFVNDSFTPEGVAKNATGVAVSLFGSSANIAQGVLSLTLGMILDSFEFDPETEKKITAIWEGAMYSNPINQQEIEKLGRTRNAIRAFPVVGSTIVDMADKAKFSGDMISKIINKEQLSDDEIEAFALSLFSLGSFITFGGGVPSQVEIDRMIVNPKLKEATKKKNKSATIYR